LKHIYKYGFYTLAISYLVVICLAVSTDYIEDKTEFSWVLLNLGSFGSFIGGIATFVAAIAACVGIKIWFTQLKGEKVLSAIWNFKSTLIRFESEFYFWHAFYKSENQNMKDLSLESKRKIKSCLEKLENLSYQLDSFCFKDSIQWGNQVRILKMSFSEHNQYLESTDFSADKSDEVIQHSLDVHRRFTTQKKFLSGLNDELDQLEKSLR